MKKKQSKAPPPIINLKRERSRVVAARQFALEHGYEINLTAIESRGNLIHWASQAVKALRGCILICDCESRDFGPCRHCRKAMALVEQIEGEGL